MSPYLLEQHQHLAWSGNRSLQLIHDLLLDSLLRQRLRVRHYVLVEAKLIDAAHM